jgi:ammonium transporter, Amt family
MTFKNAALSTATLIALTSPSVALAEEEAAAAPAVSPEMFTTNNLWMMICTALVFAMHLGFATVESGLSRSKNTTNILFKNVFIVCIGLLTYYVVGFNLMYPGSAGNGYFGFTGFGLELPEGGDTSAYNVGYTYWTDFLFQGMFAATCATIISGAVAERVKLTSFMVFATLFVAFVYPIAGYWKWGGGFLNAMGFYDFAGSTLVHSVGGWGALVGAAILGPRLGKFGKDGKVNPMPGSNMPLATIGVMILWLGWFGFNGGSVLSANPATTSFALVTTCLAAAAGGVGSIVAYAFFSKKPDLSMLLNGILAGLVGITAGADVISPGLSILVGFIAGCLVVGSVVLMDKVKIDDPVGAVSVHLTCGVWGTLAVGLFSSNPDHSLGVQLIGIAAYAAASLIGATVLFFAIKATMGLRVSAEEELEGLDAGEHGTSAYNLTLGEIHAPVMRSMSGEPSPSPAE